MDAKRHVDGFSLVSLAAIVIACSGSDGARGEPGPAGPQGEPGAPGTNGTKGADGIDGVHGKDGDAGPPGPHKPARLLDERIGGWKDANRAALNQLLTNYGIASASFDPSSRPVVVFDWDNTVIKNDIGDGTFAWLVANDKIRQPPNSDWTQTNANLTTAAQQALNAACDAAASPGEPLPTSTTPACAAEIMNVYYNGTTAAGSAAWNNQSTCFNNQPYAWVAQLLAGYRPNEIRAFARSAFEQNLAAPVGTKQTVGGVELAGYIRVYEQIRDLALAFDDNGFDVWVVTASPQYVVDGLASEIGVPPNRVIGIRTVLSQGVSTYDFQGCGNVADGDNTLITFDQGKRCWINKVIFGEPPASQLATNPDPKKRPVFVAGDSDTDISMLKDATVLKLAIERNKLQISCNMLANYMSKWLHEPMFIEPKTPPASYACSTGAECDGSPIVDEAGNPIPDQTP